MSNDHSEQNIPSWELLEMTTTIVSAHVSNNMINPTDLPSLIQNVYRALNGANTPAQLEPAKPERPEPAIAIRKSVQPDYIVCLEDGRKLKMLKRHLKTTYNMTPDEYRARWNLPADYPMVAPNYAAKRSALAQEIGLGKQKRATPPAAKQLRTAKKAGRKAAS